jgi:hypothetical protein
MTTANRTHCRPPTSYTKVLRNDCLQQLWLRRPKLLHHLFLRKFPRALGLLRTIQNKLKPDIQLTLNHLRILQKQLGIVRERFLLFRCVVEVGAVGAGEALGESGGDPGWRADPGVKFGDAGGNVGDDLDAAAADADYGNAFRGEVEGGVVGCTVDKGAFKRV